MQSSTVLWNMEETRGITMTASPRLWRLSFLSPNLVLRRSSAKNPKNKAFEAQSDPPLRIQTPSSNQGQYALASKCIIVPLVLGNNGSMILNGNGQKKLSQGILFESLPKFTGVHVLPNKREYKSPSPNPHPSPLSAPLLQENAPQEHLRTAQP